jgi:NAD(P)-dependent dehydrogenase (short-subunit alcohol dehydrogenase family)
MELELNGKVALVTGAKREIGFAIAAELVSEGMHPPLWRDSDRLTQVAYSLGRISNISGHAISADLRQPKAPAEAIAQAVAQFGRLDLVANNAGATKRADFFSHLQTKTGMMDLR